MGLSGAGFRPLGCSPLGWDKLGEDPLQLLVSCTGKHPGFPSTLLPAQLAASSHPTSDTSDTGGDVPRATLLGKPRHEPSASSPDLLNVI